MDSKADSFTDQRFLRPISIPGSLWSNQSKNWRQVYHRTMAVRSSKLCSGRRARRPGHQFICSGSLWLSAYLHVLYGLDDCGYLHCCLCTINQCFGLWRGYEWHFMGRIPGKDSCLELSKASLNKFRFSLRLMPVRSCLRFFVLLSPPTSLSAGVVVYFSRPASSEP